MIILFATHEICPLLHPCKRQLLYFPKKERYLYGAFRPFYPPLNYTRIVSRLEEIGEMNLDGMIGRVRADFPARLCREVAFCTQGRVRLLLATPDDGGALEMPTDAEQQVLSVQFGRKLYGILIFSLCQQEPALQEQELEGMRSLARTCAELLRHFELASLVFNGPPVIA